MNRNNRIIIVSIYNTNGGSLVLNTLCSLFNESGYDAKVFLCKYPIMTKKYSEFRFLINHLLVTIKTVLANIFPFLNQIFPNKFYEIKKLKKLKFKILPFYNKNNTIVIYPEIFYGNPLKAKKVVRWLLYHNRYPNDSEAYSKNDIFISFRRIFNDPRLNPNEYIITIKHFDSDLYRQYNFKKREGNCYIIRKGKNRKDLPEAFDGPVFDNNMSDKEFVKILNRCKYCYSYDTQTFYTAIAAVCGCIPIIVPENGKSRSDYLSNDEKGYGLAYGNSKEQIEFAINTRKLLIKSLDFRKKNQQNLELLIDILEKYFGNLYKKD